MIRNDCPGLVGGSGFKFPVRAVAVHSLCCKTYVDNSKIRPQGSAPTTSIHGEIRIIRIPDERIYGFVQTAKFHEIRVRSIADHGREDAFRLRPFPEVVYIEHDEISGQLLESGTSVVVRAIGIGKVITVVVLTTAYK